MSVTKYDRMAHNFVTI